MRSIASSFSLPFLMFLPLALGLGILGDSLGFKTFALVGMGLAIYGILMVPMEWGIFLIFIYIGLEGFLKIISNYHPVVHVGSDIVVLTLCARVLLKVVLDGVTVKEYPPLTKLFIIHFTWLIVVFFNPYSLGIIPSLGGSKIYITMFLLYFFGYYNTKSLKDVRFFMIPFTIIMLINLVFGLYQASAGPGSVLSIHPRYAVQLAKYEGLAFRPFGLTNNPGTPALFVYMTLPFLLYYLFSIRSLLFKFAILALLPLEFMLLLVCQIRAAILKSIMGGMMFFLGTLWLVSRVSPEKTKNYVGLATLVSLILALALPFLMESTVDLQEDNQRAIERSLTLFDAEIAYGAREGAWGRFVMYLKEVPFGAGFARIGAAAGAFKKANHADPHFGFGYFFADNLWVAALVELGIPGVLFLFLLISGIFFSAIVALKRLKHLDHQIAFLALLSVLLSISVGFLAGEGALYNPESGFFWFFSGVMLKIPKLDSEFMPEVDALSEHELR